FDKRDIEPLFPFGHGLSYTRFEYSGLVLSGATIGSEETLEASFTLSNSGDCAGAEVVQLYIADLEAPDDRPAQALQGFVRCDLDSGASTTISLAVAASELRIFDPTHNTWVLEPGRMELRIGSSSRDIRLRAPFQVTANTRHNNVTRKETP
ncbi:MAG: hypothetical protein HKN19_04165, partial [Halioglobus sp.]|nr:hypothetical protein [Halioglobus sp.]